MDDLAERLATILGEFPAGRHVDRRGSLQHGRSRPAVYWASPGSAASGTAAARRARRARPAA
jgi:hypothetical protein